MDLKAIRAEIEACGGKYHIVKSIDDVIKILESEGDNDKT